MPRVGAHEAGQRPDPRSGADKDQRRAPAASVKAGIAVQKAVYGVADLQFEELPGTLAWTSKTPLTDGIVSVASPLASVTAVAPPALTV